MPQPSPVEPTDSPPLPGLPHEDETSPATPKAKAAAKKRVRKSRAKPKAKG